MMWPYTTEEQKLLAKSLERAEAARRAASQARSATGADALPRPANDDRTWDPQIIICK